MSLLVVVLLSAVWFVLAYLIYGGLLGRLLRLDPQAKVPAVEMRDDVDYVPIDWRFLIGQHFSAIAAAGPIVGPILAGAMFGWLPALLWILFGAVFVGGVHDLTSLIASVRHKARSIAELVNEYMTRRSYLLFLTFMWVTLVYIIVAFADITASSFVGLVELENGEKVLGGGIATSSLLYLALPLVMGLLMRFTKLSLAWATLIFLPLVGVAIGVGQYIPLDIARLFGIDNASAQKGWGVALLIYCYAASVIPMWLLLQPRGHLGGFFLLFSLVGATLGLILGGEKVQFPAFTGFTTPKGEPMFPLLFIVIACGACSGFHAIVSSGTSSKQLRSEPQAKIIGYGAMLLEGLVAVVSLCCVMMVLPKSPLVAGPKGPQPNFLYACGIGKFLAAMHIPMEFGVSFGLMAFATFVYDTLDVATRLGRYVIEELTNWRGRLGKVFATAVTVGVPMYFLIRQSVDESGRIVAAWRVYWKLFGASNQLLAALTLVGVTVWLWRTRRAAWVWFVTGVPAMWMYVVSIWELIRTVRVGFARGITSEPVPWVAAILIALAALVFVEAVRVVALHGPSRSGPSAPASASA